MYYFTSGAVFDRALAAERANPSLPELYIAPLYQWMLEWQMPVFFDLISLDQIFFSGTPEEYIEVQRDASALMQSFGLAE